MVLRIDETGVSTYSAEAEAEAEAAAGADDDEAAGAEALAGTNFSTSSLRMRPSGPVPLTSARGTPFSWASRRAIGEAKTRPPLEAASDGCLGASAGVSLVPTAVLGAGVSRGPEVSFLDSTSLAACSLEGGVVGAASEPEAARASAPEKSSPSSPTMAMRVPTGRPLAPSSTYGGGKGDAAQSQSVVWGHTAEEAPTMILTRTPSSVLAGGEGGKVQNACSPDAAAALARVHSRLDVHSGLVGLLQRHEGRWVGQRSIQRRVRAALAVSRSAAMLVGAGRQRQAGGTRGRERGQERQWPPRWGGGGERRGQAEGNWDARATRSGSISSSVTLGQSSQASMMDDVAAAEGATSAPSAPSIARGTAAATHNLEKDVSSSEGLALLLLPRRDATLGHGGRHGGEGVLGEGLAPRRGRES